jgi:glycosyltransferase involved in cell wall biosynthesis
MNVFLALVTLLWTLTFLVLYLRDLSPRRAFHKALRRLTGLDLEPKPLPMDGPFSRPGGIAAGTATSRRPLHRPWLLNFETYEGTGQCCHPDAVHIAEGFGAGRWRYWMALTPYPHARDRFENPSIYVSQDGVNWEAPGPNPVVQLPPLETDHLSDVDMIFTGNHLRLYYRESLYSVMPAEHRILVTESQDGITWSPPICAISSSRDLLCSPAVVESDGVFLLWEVSGDVIRRRESPDGINWSPPTEASTSGLPDGQVPWHLDVYRQGRKLHLILNSRGVDGHRLHYGFSLDDGHTWMIRPYLIERVYGFEWGQHYRATMMSHPEHEGIYQLWYSARSRDLVWSIAYMHLVDHGDDMIPAEVAPSAVSVAPFAASGSACEEPLALEDRQIGDELVSVIIPAYNARSTIREALESVRAQTYRNLDIIIVDDGSKDGTPDAVEDIAAADPRVRIIRRETNGGIPSTRNIGINASRGVYLSFLDADDLWHPDKIMLQVEKMRECGPHVAVVYCWSTYMDADTRIIPRRVFARTFEGDVFSQLLISNFINNTWLVRRSCLDETGYYREDLVAGNEDLQIYLDLAARFDFVVVRKFLTAYRLLPTSKSHDVHNMRKGHQAVLAHARREHPSLPNWLFRWSESNQLWFLGFRCLRAGRVSEGVRLIIATFRRDPGFVLRPTVRHTLMRAIVSRLLGLGPRLQVEGQRRPFLDGGPPPELEVPQIDGWIERWRARRVSSVSLRSLTPKMSARPDSAIGSRPGLMPTASRR